MATREQEGNPAAPRGIEKASSGIPGLDTITGGGLPRGRTTLICGSAGCGKTMLGTEFLVHGALVGEPGVFVTFEETARELAQNAASLGHELDRLVAEQRLVIEHVRLERSEIAETGDYDLDGLFLRLGHAIDVIGARRVVLDTIEALFAGLSNEAILRAELRRLFRWLKDRGVTAVVTAECAPERQVTRHGLEEFVSDCVIVLDHRVVGQVSTRRLRITKYRGTSHGTNEYPFLIDRDGIKVLPITSLGLEHEASTERIPTGIAELDAMLGGDGFYRGSTILVSGSAGTGKTSIASHFAAENARRGERTLYLSFEESASQIARNQRSIGLELPPWIERGLIRFRSIRGTHHGLEMHLATIHALVEEFDPAALVLDPITALQFAGSELESSAMLVRLIDFLKVRGVTTLMTDLLHGSGSALSEQTSVNISSIVDTWILLRDVEHAGERNRVLYVLKSRGMPHSNQVREYRLGAGGFEFREVYVGREGVLTGTLRVAQEAREAESERRRDAAVERRQRELERKREALEARIAALRLEFEGEREELEDLLVEATLEREDTQRVAESRSRHARGSPPRGEANPRKGRRAP